MTGTFQFKACMDECQAVLNQFLAHFTVDANALPSDGTRCSRPEVERFFTPLVAQWGLHSLAPGGSASAALAAAGTSPSDAALLQDRRQTLELALKLALSRPLRSGAQQSSFASATHPVSLLLDAALRCKTLGLLESIAPLGLVEDLLESSTIPVAEALFNHALQPRIDSFIRASDGQRARLLFFRTCNALMRRLSKSANTSFAGKISMQLSYVCNVDERSAVNVAAKFNRDNVTIAEGEEGTEEQGAVKEEPSTAVKKEDDSASVAVKKEDASTGSADGAEVKPSATTKEPSFYSLLWGLQNFFSDPLALKAPLTLASFTRCAESVLGRFESLKLGEKESLAAISSSLGASKVNDAAPVFPKYLTSARLTELQLKDALFRREVTLQILTFLAYVLNPQGSVEIMKELLSGVGGSSSSGSSGNQPPTPTSASSMPTAGGSFLPASSVPALRTLFSRALRGLKLTPPGGLSFSEAFLALLVRETRFWTAWKEQKCPSIERAWFSREALDKTMDVAQVAKAEKEKREKKVAGASGATTGKDATTAAGADSKKRKASALSSSGGPFGGRGASSASGLGKSKFPVAPGTGRVLMGSPALAELWDPTSEANQDVGAFLRSEERASSVPDPRHDFVQRLVDEERDWLRQAAWNDAEEAKVKAWEVRVEALKASGKDVAEAGERPVKADYPDFELDKKDMLKHQPVKPWQFLRLALSTPRITAVWLEASASADAPTAEQEESKSGPSASSAAEQEPPEVTGLEVFMRSEGSLPKLVESWTAERKRKVKAAAGGGHDATTGAAAMTDAPTEAAATDFTAAPAADAASGETTVPGVKTEDEPLGSEPPPAAQAATEGAEDADSEQPRKKLRREGPDDTSPVEAEQSAPTAAAEASANAAPSAGEGMQE